MWNNLRARHYSVIILLAIVALETSAITIDKFINRESETAFTIESPFQNNPFIQSFRMADASCAVLPVRMTNAKASTQGAVVINKRTISADFMAAASENDSFKNCVEYSVQSGDSLSNIAVLFGAEADAIKRANKIDDNHSIMAGQTIKVPMPSKDMYYTVRKGDSLSRIANRFRVQLKDIVETNNLKSHMLVAEQKIKIPVVDNRAKVAIVKPENNMAEVGKKMELVREAKAGIVYEPKLQMIKVEKIQMAAAPAVKPKLDFAESDLLISPPKIDLSASLAPAAPVVAKADGKNDNREVSYTIAKGDSLLKVAMRFNTTVAQLQIDNNLNGTFLKVGQEIKINPDKKLFRVVKAEKVKLEPAALAKMVEHKVQNGESLSAIAKKYKTTIGAIVAGNNLANTVVMSGQTIRVPATEVRDFKVTQGRSEITRASWKMPVRGRLSDAYGWRNHPVYRKRLFHAGIDIAAPKGAPIASACNGRVIYAGRRSGYGNLVIVSHANGMSTRYAHCSSIIVKKGQSVRAGQLLARVGATGVATGNHLHFEVRKNGKPQNPLTFLR